jgi:hypothetical protein
MSGKRFLLNCNMISKTLTLFSLLAVLSLNAQVKPEKEKPKWRLTLAADGLSGGVHIYENTAYAFRFSNPSSFTVNSFGGFDQDLKSRFTLSPEIAFERLHPNNFLLSLGLSFQQLDVTSPALVMESDGSAPEFTFTDRYRISQTGLFAGFGFHKTQNKWFLSGEARVRLQVRTSVAIQRERNDQGSPGFISATNEGKYFPGAGVMFRVGYHVAKKVMLFARLGYSATTGMDNMSSEVQMDENYSVWYTFNATSYYGGGIGVSFEL